MKKNFQIEVIELPKYTACRKGEFKETGKAGGLNRACTVFAFNSKSTLCSKQ